MFRPIIVPFLILLVAWFQEIIDQFVFGGSWNLPMGPGLPWWHLLTAPFSHSGFGHLFSNSLIFLPVSWLVMSKGFFDYIAVLLGVILLEVPIALFWPN